MATLPLLRIQRLTFRIYELRSLHQQLHPWMRRSTGLSRYSSNSKRQPPFEGDNFLSSHDRRNFRNNGLIGGINVSESCLPEDAAKVMDEGLVECSRASSLSHAKNDLDDRKGRGDRIGEGGRLCSDIGTEDFSFKCSDIGIKTEKVSLNAKPADGLREDVADGFVTASSARKEDTIFEENESKSQDLDYNTKEKFELSKESEPSEIKNLNRSDITIADINLDNSSIQRGEIDADHGIGVAMGTESPVVRKQIKPTFNLAPLVFESNTLQNLVTLGVDLSQLEKYEGLGDLILKLDFEKDVSPYLLFLKDFGVEDLGKYLTRNPLIFQQSIDDLNVRIGYLESKKFSKESVKRIVSKAPLFLSLPVTTVDRKLGFLQNSFHLTGNEVREVATKLPKIITWKLDKIKENRNYIHQFLGFTLIELKKMLLIHPKVFLMDKYAVGKKFDFLHNTMGLDHKRLLEWPSVFGTRLHNIKNRHLYLLKVERAQYDPSKENFVSLKALCSGRDGEFCVNVAKTSVKEYNDFLKCL